MVTIGASSADKYITTVLYTAGLWSPEKPSLLYHLRGWFVLCVLMGSWVLCLDIGLALTENMAAATHALCVSIPTTVFLTKAFNLYMNNRMIQSCLMRVHNFRLEDSKEEELAKNQLKTFYKFVVFYAVICNLTITFVSWHVVFYTKPELPFAGWYPYLDWQHNNRDYWIVQSIQFYGMVIAVNINLCCELFPCFFLTVIGCQMEILGLRLSKLNSNPSSVSKRNNAESKMVEKSIDGIVKDHYYIMRLGENVFFFKCSANSSCRFCQFNRRRTEKLRFSIFYRSLHGWHYRHGKCLSSLVSGD